MASNRNRNRNKKQEQVDAPVAEEEIQVEEQEIVEENVITPEVDTEPVVTDEEVTENVVEEDPIVQENEESLTDNEVKSETESVDAILDKDGVAKLLVAQDKSFIEKLTIISKRAIPMYSSLAAKLISYEETMGKGIVDPSLGSSKQYDLYNTIKTVLSEQDSYAFKVKFDIINIAYIAFSKGAFSDVKLFRFSELWKWGETSLEEYQNLNIILTQLSNIADRANNINKIDMVTALEGSSVSFSPVAVSNIKKYYNN